MPCHSEEHLLFICKSKNCEKKEFKQANTEMMHREQFRPKKKRNKEREAKTNANSYETNKFGRREKKETAHKIEIYIRIIKRADSEGRSEKKHITTEQHVWPYVSARLIHVLFEMSHVTRAQTSSHRRKSRFWCWFCMCPSVCA